MSTIKVTAIKSLLKKWANLNHPEIASPNLSAWGFDHNYTYLKANFIKPFCWKTYLSFSKHEEDSILFLDTFPVPYAQNAIKIASSFFEIDLLNLDHKISWSMKDLNSFNRLQLHAIYIYPSKLDSEPLFAKSILIDRIIWSLNISHQSNGNMITTPFPYILIENYNDRIILHSEDPIKADSSKIVWFLRESTFIKKYISMDTNDKPKIANTVGEKVKFAEVGKKPIIIDTQLDVHWVLLKMLMSPSYLVYKWKEFKEANAIDEAPTLESFIRNRPFIELCKEVPFDLVYILIHRIEILLSSSAIYDKFRYVSQIVIHADDDQSLERRLVQFKMIWILDENDFDASVIQSLMQCMGHFMCIFEVECKVIYRNKYTAESIEIMVSANELDLYFTVYEQDTIRSLIGGQSDLGELQTAKSIEFAIAVKEILSSKTLLSNRIPCTLKWAFAVSNKFSNGFYRLMYHGLQSNDFEL